MSLSKDVANHKHLLFTAFAERRTRLVALAWILAQKTQLSRGFTLLQRSILWPPYTSMGHLGLFK